MRKIPYFEKKLTVEEFVKEEVVKNAGTNSLVYKDDLINLINMCLEKNLAVEKMGKRDLFELLIESGYTYQEFAKEYGIGVSSQIYQKQFGLSHKDVKKLEKRGILKVVNKYKFRAYGKELEAPLYDVYQFASISEQTIKEGLE